MTTTTALTLAVTVLFAATGAVKLIGLPASLKIRDHLRLSPALWRLIGTLEMAGALGALAGLWFRPLEIAATAGLTALMAGAIVSRIRIRDAAIAVLFDVLVFALAATTLTLSAGD